MSTAVKARPQAADARDSDDTQPADVFVVFGITGDLAKVMTFRSLYRLEARGLLDCPIVGVAVSDWSDDDLREHAREAIVAGGQPLDEDVGRLCIHCGASCDDVVAQSSPERGDL